MCNTMASVKNVLNSIFIAHIVNHNPNLLSRASFDCAYEWIAIW